MDKPEPNLRLSEKKFRTMADAAPVILWVSGPDGSCIHINRRWYDFTGQTEEDALGFGWLDSVHPDDAEWSGQVFSQASEERRPFSLTYRLKSRDGAYRWMIDTGSPHFGENGEFEGFVGAVLDIHERKLAEEALAEQKQQYENIFQSTSDAIFIFDYDGTLVEANAAAHLMHGYTYEEFIGLNGRDFIHPDDHPKFREFFSAVRAGRKYFVQGTHLKKDGSPLYVEVVGSGLIFQGQPHLVAVVRDVTEKKKAKAALRATKSLRKSLLEASPDCVKILTPGGYLVYMNHTGRDLLAVEDFTTIEGACWVDFWKGAHRQAAEQAIAAGKTEGFGHFIGFCPTMKGRPKWWDVRISPIHDPEGNISQLLCVSRDITEQKQNQEALEEKSRELEFANEDLKNFAYTLSHDLKGPLATLRATSALAAEAATVEEIREILALVDSRSQRIDEILEGLIQIIREERTDGNVESIDVAGIISEVLTDLNEEIAGAGADIWLNIDRKEVRFVRSYLRSILRNLIDNAVKYRADGRRPVISITVAGSGPVTTFAVRDNGIGIDLDRHRHLLFQPFKRLSERQPGTGIGLFLIRRMIEKHGGEIWVESKMGEGSAFYFTITGAAG